MYCLRYLYYSRWYILTAAHCYLKYDITKVKLKLESFTLEMNIKKIIK